jgi:hypothetical protein
VQELHVAFSIGAGRLGRDIRVVGAGGVFDDDLLLELCAYGLGNHASHRVGRAADCKRHDDRDRLGRKFLRMDRHRCGNQGKASNFSTGLLMTLSNVPDG